MRPKRPELLLLFYLVLPISQGPLVAQVLLSQIRAIYVARQAEKKLTLEEYGADEPEDESGAQAVGVEESGGQELSSEQAEPDSNHPNPAQCNLIHHPIAREFLSALWLDPSNMSAYAYSGILFPLIADCRLQTPAEGFDRL